MKRSEINREIREALQFFEDMNFRLPTWGYWSPEEWRQNSANYDEIIQNQLGWDLTDFGLGSYKSTGLLLFTIRNGNLQRDQKPYAEKVMIVDEGQLTPLHFHWTKMEDIINRGGGTLIMQLYASGEQGELAESKIEVSIDGIRKTFGAGEFVRLEPGESITLYPGLYHKFYGEKGKGKVLVGEVSAVNDDHSDNRFYEQMGRFPDIEEDESPAYLLTLDYNSLRL